MLEWALVVRLPAPTRAFTGKISRTSATGLVMAGCGGEPGKDVRGSGRSLGDSPARFRIND